MATDWSELVISIDRNISVIKDMLNNGENDAAYLLTQSVIADAEHLSKIIPSATQSTIRPFIDFPDGKQTIAELQDNKVPAICAGINVRF